MRCFRLLQFKMWTRMSARIIKTGNNLCHWTAFVCLCVCVFVFLLYYYFHLYKSSPFLVNYSVYLCLEQFKLMRFWTVSKSWTNEKLCVWNCNTAKEGSPKLCLSHFAVAMRCDRCIYLFIYLFGGKMLQLLHLSPAPHLCVQLMCQCSDWTGISFPHTFFMDHIHLDAFPS